VKEKGESSLDWEKNRGGRRRALEVGRKKAVTTPDHSREEIPPLWKKKGLKEGKKGRGGICPGE